MLGEGGYQRLVSLFPALFRAVIPPACPFCRKTLSPCSPCGELCSACVDELIPLPRAHCPRCALPFTAQANSSHLCSRCLKKPPPFAQVYCCGLYSGSLRRAIQQFKFSGRVALDRALGKLLAAAVVPDWPYDLVIPVPMERHRQQQRGYNQAVLLARELVRATGGQLDQKLLVKCRTTVVQHDLPARERRINLNGAFALGRQLPGGKVLLVDDVMTTGATAEACARTLLQGGADEVRVAVLARAPLSNGAGG